MIWCGTAWNNFERHGTLLHPGVSLPPFLPCSTLHRHPNNSCPSTPEEFQIQKIPKRRIWIGFVAPYWRTASISLQDQLSKPSAVACLALVASLSMRPSKRIKFKKILMEDEFPAEPRNASAVTCGLPPLRKKGIQDFRSWASMSAGLNTIPEPWAAMETIDEVWC